MKVRILSDVIVHAYKNYVSVSCWRFLLKESMSCIKMIDDRVNNIKDYRWFNHTIKW